MPLARHTARMPPLWACVRHVKEAAGGFLLTKEVNALQQLLHGAAKPFVAVVGGAKVADKVGVLEALLSKVDVLCIGGAMAYTFLKAQGVDIGKSRLEEDKLRVASDVLKRAKDRGVEVLLPTDHVCAREFSEKASPTNTTTPNIPPELMALDIGPDTRKRYAVKSGVLQPRCFGTVRWACSNGTSSQLARAPWQKRSRITTAIPWLGGGDSVAAIEAMGVQDQVSHVSTGGGASLELLQYGTLPGLDALYGKI